MKNGSDLELRRCPSFERRADVVAIMFACFGFACGPRERSVPTPPAENMAPIPEGTYRVTSAGVAPDKDSVCTLEIKRLANSLDQDLVAKFIDTDEHINAFDIDRDIVSCAGYRDCAAQKRCPELLPGPERCYEGGAVVTLRQATAYCEARGLRLPTVAEWQAAVRGAEGRGYVDCEPPDGSQQCVFMSPAGVIARLLHAHDEFTSTLRCETAPGDPMEDVEPVHMMIRLGGKELTGVVPVGPSGARFAAKRASRLGWFRCVRDAQRRATTVEAAPVWRQ